MAVKDASPKEKPTVPKFLRPEEANRLIEAAGKRGRHRFRDKVLVRMVYRHGLRASEATDLRWSQIDLDAGTLIVHRAKGGNAFTHHMDRDELGDMRKHRAKITGPFVFESERGGPLSVDALQDVVSKAGKLAGLTTPERPRIHPHMLRHGAGYSLINQGHDLRTVQEFLGHKNITSTAIYTALDQARLAKVRVR
jgi:type 1 fimbriae regulatory protein FimB/type 1 fimbriae regulatory protein FimE